MTYAVNSAYPFADYVNSSALGLPQELSINIFGYLNCEGIKNCQLVCKHWKQLLEGADTWRKLFERHFPFETGLSKIKNYQEAYKKQHLFLSNLRKGIYTSHILEGHCGWVKSLLMANGHLISGSYDGTVKIWDIDKGSFIRNLEQNTKWVTSLAIVDKKLISACYDGTLKIWDAATYEFLATIKQDDPSTAVINAGGKLVSGSLSGRIAIWNLNQDPPVQIAALEGHTEWISSFAAHGNKLISGSWDTTIKVWDLETYQCLATMNEHKNWVVSLVIDDGKLISSSLDCEIKTWDLNTFKCVGKIDAGKDWPVFCLVSDRFLISGTEGARIKIWDMDKSTCINTFVEHKEAVSKIIQTDGKLITGSYDHTIRVWDFTANRNAVFEELAGLFESRDADFNPLINDRFSRMPESEKKCIYDELYKIIKPNLIKDYSGCEEDAFYGRNMQVATGHQKAQAIRNYLAGRSS